jgi:hypothetical protein
MLKSDLKACSFEIKELKQRLDHSSRYKFFSPPCEFCGTLKGKLLHATKENSELKQEVAYLSAHLERTKLSKKMIEDNLSRVEESATKYTYKLGIGFDRCEDKGEKSAHKFIPSSNYHKEEETVKSIKTHYPSNPKPAFKPKREVRKETPKPREEAFICMFCGHVGYLDEFCFRRMRIEKKRFDYARNSYNDEFIDFPPRTSSHASPHFFHGPNHRSYGFDSRENSFVPRRFGYGPRPHRGDHPSRSHGFPAGGSYTCFEPRHLDGPHFPHCGSRLTHSNGDVQKTVKSSSGCMVKCWIPKCYLTNPSTEPSTSSRPV